MLEYGGSGPVGDLLRVDCDILVPAATQDVVDEDVARATQARLVVEGANMPTTAPALALLAARGIPVVPDFIANADGSVAAAFSMDNRYSPFATEPRQIFDHISAKMRANAHAVLAAGAEWEVTPHVAARRLAQERVRAAMQLRGQIAPEPTGATGLAGAPC